MIQYSPCPKILFILTFLYIIFTMYLHIKYISKFARALRWEKKILARPLANMHGKKNSADSATMKVVPLITKIHWCYRTHKTSIIIPNYQLCPFPLPSWSVSCRLQPAHQVCLEFTALL